MANPLDKFNARNNSFMDNVKANVSNVLNANPIGDFKRNISDAYTGSLNKILDEPLAHKLDVDTRGMYYGSPTTKEIYDYRSDIGTLGNIRHATTTAQYKDKIAQGLVPEHMKNIGAKPGFVENLIGGVGANILGLGHEFEGLTKDWSQIKDPNFWKATGEDVLANLYGSIKGKTGVSEQEIYDSMLGNFIYDEGIMSNVLDWGTITGDKEKKGMSLQRFKNIYEIKKNRQQRIWKATREAEAAAATKAKAKAKADAAAQASQRQADQARISRAYREETGGQAGSYAPGGGSGAHAADASGSTYSDPFDPGGGEARGGFIDGTNRRRNYLDGGLIDFFRYGGFIG